ncbi:MAG TPA: prolyl oligopeptidase family serine peptidase [Bacteroidales bacterium]|nr:prolyl oligopeptidase family serine peptidase [Bacteroidales bacterium]
MKNIVIPVLTAMIIMMISSCIPEKGNKLNYPVTQKVEQTDEYFGVKVEDPYRWLEDDNSEETAAWVLSQNTFTQDYLAQIPFRGKIADRLKEIWNYPRYRTPEKRGEHIYFRKNDGLQNQDVLYVTKEGMEAEVLLDPNTFSEDGTVALSSWNISGDDKYLGYLIARAGSDWQEIQVMDLETGTILEDHIKWVKFSGISWKGHGFFYSSYDPPAEGDEYSNVNENHKVYYHKLGTKQEEDQLIYQNLDFPRRNYYVGTTEDERFLIMSESESTSGNSLYLKDLSAKNNDFIKLADGFEYDYEFLGNKDNDIYIKTNEGAPKGMVFMLNVQDLLKGRVTIIPEKEEVLQSVALVGGKMISEYMADAASKAYIHDLSGEVITELGLPGLGSFGGLSGRADDNVAFYSYTSFTYPATIFKLNIDDNSSEVFFPSGIDFDADLYETKQIFYTSKDGTQVPMFIIHKKGLEMDGNNPTLLYGYGGFNISLTPYFSTSNIILLENGGVYALANIRGGGEYGEEWHEAGTLKQKQNVFDDFISAAEFLIREGYTSSDKLAIMGGSNGGLLIGACMTQRPELFKVAFPQVGVLDMLRYHKFTIGWAWATDYGTSEDDSSMFSYLLGYSPLHNVRSDVEYPATMIFTADHDDRVVPAHSFKFAATLQEHQSGRNPVLIRIESKAGHGAGTPVSKIIDEVADQWAFMFYNMGVTPGY